MSSYNSVQLIGNLTRDPEVKYLANGTAVCDLSLAINSSYTPKGGEKKEQTDYFDITFFGRTAEICGEYLAKGRSCMVVGRLKQESWTDKTTGDKRSKVKVAGEQLIMLGSKGDSSSKGGSSRSDSSTSSDSDSSSFSPSADSSGDDVPF